MNNIQSPLPIEAAEIINENILIYELRIIEDSGTNLLIKYFKAQL